MDVLSVAVLSAVLALGWFLGAYCLFAADAQPLAGRPEWTCLRWLVRGLGVAAAGVTTALYAESEETRMSSWERRFAWCLCIVAVLVAVMCNHYSARLARFESETEAMKSRTETVNFAAQAARDVDRARIDYLEWRETAQKLVNDVTIKRCLEVEGRLKEIESRPHKVDEDNPERIPKQSVPTVPPDPD